MKTQLLLLFLLCGCLKAATFSTTSPSVDTATSAVPGSPGLYFPTFNILSLQLSNAVENLVLSQSFKVVTNWSRLGVERNGTAFPALGRLLVRNEGTYLVTYRISASLSLPNDVTYELFRSGVGTGIRARQALTTATVSHVAASGLLTLDAGDILTVRAVADSGAPTLTIREAGISAVQLFD